MKKLCTRCLHVGSEDYSKVGNFRTEMTIWTAAFLLAFVGVFDAFFWLPATIFFFVALFYTITISRLNYCVCPNCKVDSMIPINSPRAMLILGDDEVVKYEVIAPPERSVYGVPFKGILLVLTAFLIAIILYNHFG